jgi:hypothetical protein
MSMENNELCSTINMAHEWELTETVEEDETSITKDEVCARCKLVRSFVVSKETSELTDFQYFWGSKLPAANLMELATLGCVAPPPKKEGMQGTGPRFKICAHCSGYIKRPIWVHIAGIKVPFCCMEHVDSHLRRASDAAKYTWIAMNESETPVRPGDNLIVA